MPEQDTEQIGMEIRYGEKVVYEVLRQIKLEVQFVKPDDAHLRPSKHTEYRIVFLRGRLRAKRRNNNFIYASQNSRRCPENGGVS